jgi:FlaA1/EpsC-like NDP-sugar epimerase
MRRLLVAFSAHSSLSRGWVALAWVMALTFVVAERRAFRKVVHRIRRRGFLGRAVLVVGTDGGARSQSEAVMQAA